MSVRAKLAKIMLRHQLSGWSEGSIEEQRAKQENTIRFARLPADILCQPVSANGVAAEWIGAPDSDCVLPRCVGWSSTTVWPGASLSRCLA